MDSQWLFKRVPGFRVSGLGFRFQGLGFRVFGGSPKLGVALSGFP